MTQPPAYEREPYRRTLAVEIVKAGRDGELDYAVLDDTILYPEGGGQPADRGRLAGVAVVDVQRVDGEIRHVIESAASQGPAELELDWVRRYDHMQQHTAQHLLTAIAAERFGWRTTSFHLGANRCDIELDVESLDAQRLESLEGAAVEVLSSAHPVSARRVSAREYAAMQVRSRGLPQDHRGDVRLVQIDGVDCCTCGGTHLANTAEIETLKLLGTEPMRGGTRLFWIAGGRVRRLLEQHEQRGAQLRELLSTGNEDLVAMTAGKLDRLQQAERRIKALQRQVAEQAARQLSSGGGPVAEAHFQDADPGFLQQIGRQFVRTAGNGVALLTASGSKGDFFLLVAGPDSEVDLRRIGPPIAELLQGRGGGSDSMFQGKAGSLAGRAEAMVLLAENLRRHS